MMFFKMVRYDLKNGLWKEKKEIFFLYGSGTDYLRRFSAAMESD